MTIVSTQKLNRMRTLVFAIIAIITTGLYSFTGDQQLTITSTSFVSNGLIPVKYSCEGSEINPPLHIAHIPAQTKSLAIIVQDPDAPGKNGFTHWVIWNVGLDGNIPENYRDADQEMNSGEKNGYKGMCPPEGVHHYHFMVYALDTKLNLDHNTNKDALEKAISGHILGKRELIGLYRKTKEGEVK